MTKQGKIKAGITAVFGVIMLVLSGTEIGYVEISDHRSLDISVIPAIFAAMIGGYRVGIPIAIIWGVAGYWNPNSNLQIYTFIGSLMYKEIMLITAVASYRFFKRVYIGSPWNVYWAVICATSAKSVASNVLLTFYMNSVGVDMKVWMQTTAIEYVLETSLSLLAMGLVIRHLREVHILNGIKRKEKKK